MYFSSENNQWGVKREIRDRVVFRDLNLLDSFVLLGRFDVVFCRNVLIYFSESVRTDIMLRIAGALQPGGYLFLGGSETLTGVTDKFEVLNLCGGLAYRLKNHPGHKN